MIVCKFIFNRENAYYIATHLYKLLYIFLKRIKVKRLYQYHDMIGRHFGAKISGVYLLEVQQEMS